ncbi:MAG: hypothetical protein ACJ8G3_00360 [Burkholderiaceae bacterium]
MEKGTAVNVSKNMKRNYSKKRLENCHDVPSKPRIDRITLAKATFLLAKTPIEKEEARSQDSNQGRKAWG